MSLLGTLAKVALGIAVAKGVGSMMKKGRTGNSPSGGAPSGGSGGGFGDILEQLGGGSGTGRKPQRSPNSGGGLGDLLEQLGGGAGGGLGDILGQLGKQAGGGRSSGRSTSRQTDQASDSLGDVFGDFIKDAAPEDSHNGSFGDIFNQSLDRGGEPELPPSREQEVAAGLMLRAMIQAAKSDGTVDHAERQKLMDNLGDISREERAFVEQEFARPIDVSGLARQVPRGLEQQVYLMSVMGIDLDNRKEAQYLHDLATELEMDRNQVNGIHDHLGVPLLYS